LWVPGPGAPTCGGGSKADDWFSVAVVAAAAAALLSSAAAAAIAEMSLTSYPAEAPGGADFRTTMSMVSPLLSSRVRTVRRGYSVLATMTPARQTNWIGWL